MITAEHEKKSKYKYKQKSFGQSFKKGGIKKVSDKIYQIKEYLKNGNRLFAES